MYWFGIRDLPPAELVKLFPECQIPLVRQFIARRVAEDIDKDAAPLNTLLGLAAKPDTRADVLTGMTAALKGWRKAKKPEAWTAFAASFEGSADTPIRTPHKGGTAVNDPEADKSVRAPLAMIRDLNVLFGDGRALDEVRAIALDDKTDPESRRAALQTIIEAKAPESRDLCLKFLSDRGLGLTAVMGLATFDDPELAAKIIGRYKNFYPHERSAVVTALVSRPAFAKVLLQRVAKGEIPRTDLTPIHARQILSFKDDALSKQLTESWGAFRDSGNDKEKQKLITTLKAKLTPDAIAKADLSQGRFLYASVCASCHKLYGEGSAIGPDLTGSGRHDVNYLIENIADPSALVAADFQMRVITLKDGRILNGIIHGQTDRTITVSMVGQETTIDRGDIVKQEQLPISMMPEGLVTALSDEQLRNLIAYLMSSGQVPLPAAQ
jgi:putative heme-binding domain-containing protein